MNLLVPTDFSSCADHAINYAAIFGRRTGADLRLIHVNAVRKEISEEKLNVFFEVIQSIQQVVEKDNINVKAYN